MKRNLFLRSVFLFSLIGALASCETDKEELHYVKVGQISCTFPGSGSAPQTISVESSPYTWEADTEAGWIRASRSEDGKSLILTVDDNDSGAERNAGITITAGNAIQEIKVKQLSTDPKIAKFRKLDMFQLGAVMSPGGKYVGGFTASLAPDDSFQYTPTIIDTRTGEKYEFGPYPEAVYYLHQSMAITDQGILFINDAVNGGQVAFNLQDGQEFIPKGPEGFQFRPQISAVSADGRTYVGFATEKKMGLTKPLIWRDGKAEVLPMPETNFRDEEFTTGLMARGMSANGKVIYGSTWENYDFGMVYWKDGKVDWVGKDVRTVTTVKMIGRADGQEYDYTIVNGCICQAWNTRISPSGKWIATTFRTETQTEDRLGVTQEKFAAFYNTETERTIVIRDYGESTGLSVTDDGIGFIGMGTFAISTGKAYDLNTGTELGDACDWVHNNYGIMVPDGYISYIAPNGVALGTSARVASGRQDFIKWYITPVSEQSSPEDK